MNIEKMTADEKFALARRLMQEAVKETAKISGPDTLYAEILAMDIDEGLL